MSLFLVNVCRAYLIQFFDVLNPITYDFFRTLVVFFFNFLVYDLWSNRFVMLQAKYWVDFFVKVSD